MLLSITQRHGVPVDVNNDDGGYDHDQGRVNHLLELNKITQQRLNNNIRTPKRGNTKCSAASNT